MFSEPARFVDSDTSGDVEAKEGQKVKLRCEATGTPQTFKRRIINYSSSLFNVFKPRLDRVTFLGSVESHANSGTKLDGLKKTETAWDDMGHGCCRFL